MNIYYNLFIFYIFSIKILFVLCSSTEMYYQWKNRKLEKREKNTKTKETNENEEYKKNVQQINNLDYWKKRFEFIYIMCMSFLLIYLFNPYQKTLPLITNETRYLIFLFAFILITNANWGLFLKEPSLLIELQDRIGRSPNSTNTSTTNTKTNYLL